jgi:hypothetical protein
VATGYYSKEVENESKLGACFLYGVPKPNHITKSGEVLRLKVNQTVHTRLISIFVTPEPLLLGGTYVEYRSSHGLLSRRKHQYTAHVLKIN